MATNPIDAAAIAAISRIIADEFSDVANVRRDADRAAVRIARLLAQGIEAQRATTEGRGPKDESPVAKRCALTQSPISGDG